MFFNCRSASSGHLSLGRVVTPPFLFAGLITISLRLHRLCSVNGCCGNMFSCLLDRFVFSTMPLVMTFRYMFSSVNYSASGVHHDGGPRLCAEFDVVSGKLVKYSSSIMFRHNSFMYLCSSYSRNVLLVGQNVTHLSRSLLSLYISVCETSVTLRFLLPLCSLWSCSRALSTSLLILTRELSTPFCSLGDVLGRLRLSIKYGGLFVLQLHFSESAVDAREACVKSCSNSEGSKLILPTRSLVWWSWSSQ